MDEQEIQKLIDELRAGTYEVELDVHPYISGSNMQLVAELDDARTRAIESGERVVYVYSEERTRAHAGLRSWIRASLVNAKQALQLSEAGAKWVGPENHKPRSVG